jgi:DEAD/DEAH box helicase domain-containing protein
LKNSVLKSSLNPSGNSDISKSIARLLSRWRVEPSIADSIQVWHDIAYRDSSLSPLPDDLHPQLVEALSRQGIFSLYSHQASCLDLARHGQNLIVVTGTASGKTIAYNLPVLDSLLKDPMGRALYLFPTKALAQDQIAVLRELLMGINQHELPQPSIYDGDTPSHARQSIRSNARILLTNPDMLHIGILPHHTRWTEFFSRLRFVVIDEAHVYRGVFGSHVANLFRRLKRICQFYGCQPQFILTSATISNPQELASSLVETEVALVDRDGSGRGQKTFLMYNPPVIDQELGLRRSAMQESVRLAQDLIAYRIQTIIFGRSRRTVEMILSYLRQNMGESSNSSKDLHPKSKKSIGNTSMEAIRGYRSGYLPEKRREIERGLRQGQVRAVVATNALELGIDIGGMGAALLVGYPGTIAATWQQAGRAGRGSDRSLAVLVATADPLDQFLAAHPEYFFDRSPEQALINPDNPLILLDHLRCAAFELPFQEGETFGRIDTALLAEYLAVLEDQGMIHRSGQKFFWMSDQYPAQAISLRSASANPVRLQVLQDERPIMIGQVDWESAHWMVHPDAIYLHEAESYLVKELDLEKHHAILERIDTDYYTLPRSETTVELIELNEYQDVRGGSKSQGELLVTSQVTGYKKMHWLTREPIDIQPLEMPAVELLTTGYWLALSEKTVDQLKESGLWNNQPNEYGPNWDIQRERARKRDGYRCQVCGAPEQGRAHHVHHKTPFRMFTSYIHANVLENLVTLCPECHRRVEAAVRVRSGLAGLAHVLGNLAPFFLMCDSSDLGVHSDPQSPLADGLPAVILFDQIPAGLGFSQRLFEIHAELIQRAFELVAACPCSDGCPSCVGPGGELGAGGKEETLAILSSL